MSVCDMVCFGGGDVCGSGVVRVSIWYGVHVCVVSTWCVCEMCSMLYVVCECVLYMVCVCVRYIMWRVCMNVWCGCQCVEHVVCCMICMVCMWHVV